MTKDAAVPAISDRGQPPPTVFKQAEDKFFYALSTQKRYTDVVHKTLHGENKYNKIYGDIEIQTLVTTYKFPPKYTDRSVDLKVEISGCTRKDVFRTTLLQGYINEGWENFAK